MFIEQTYEVPCHVGIAENGELGGEGVQGVAKLLVRCGAEDLGRVERGMHCVLVKEGILIKMKWLRWESEVLELGSARE